MEGMAQSTPWQDRFWRFVDRRLPTECWLWKGYRTAKGYGLFTTPEGNRAHRLSWVMANGPIPAGAIICHRCDTPACVNPEHLFAGTAADNALDRDTKGRGVLFGATAEKFRRLTPESVVEIRHLHTTGLGYRRLARQYQVSPGTIKDVIRRRSWRHTP
jgi:hypothetical protein